MAKQLNSSEDTTFTIGKAMERLVPRLADPENRQMPLWPPDIFALCASLLQLSGAYSLIVHEDHAPKSPWNRQSEIQSYADAWITPIMNWEKLNHGKRPAEQAPSILSPSDADTIKILSELLAWWTTLVAGFPLSVDFLLHPQDAPLRVGSAKRWDLKERRDHHSKLMEAIFGLLATADEISSKLNEGSSQTSGKTDPNSTAENYSYSYKAWQRLLFNAEKQQIKRQTLCREVHPTRAIVLPKIHPPRNGLTIRNLSNYLAYLRVSDVHPIWAQFDTGNIPSAPYMNEHVNLLVIPWPPKISPTNFEAVNTIPLSKSEFEGESMPKYGLFRYNMPDPPRESFVSELVQHAEKHVGHIHGIILPETALSKADFEKIVKAFIGKDGKHESRDMFFIAGIGCDEEHPDRPEKRFPSSGLQAGSNEAVIAFKPSELVALAAGEKFFSIHSQSKHHRWKLDKHQIQQYGLGSRLHPNIQWWEFIQAKKRTVAFVELRPWLTTSVLVCEDLARPDPVGEALRAVAPNLVIALLADGPQLHKRWPGRYAAALADDPGSSVLTVTSLGMANLSVPRTSIEEKSSCIALWKDAKGETREIVMPSGADGVVLTLSPDYLPEYSADGRQKAQSIRSSYPILSGVLPVFKPKEKE